MKKPMLNVAVALLLSLGVTACGSKKNETVINTQPSVTAAELAAAKTEADNATKAAATAKSELAQAKTELANANTALANAQKAVTEAQAALKAASSANEEEAAKLQAALNAAEAQAAVYKAEKEAAEANLATATANEANKISQNLATGYFANQSSSKTYEIQKNLAKKAELVVAMENSTGTCDAGNSNACTAFTLDTGKVIYTKKNASYSGYAVVREAYDASNVGVNPINSYIAVVKTPTTDKSKVGATYTGFATYTTKNARTMFGEVANASSAVLTLNVSDNAVSGRLDNQTSKNTSAWKQLAKFDSATIVTNNDAVAFEGNATFYKAIGISSESTDGTYRGQFAGSEAQEVIGTFESSSTEKADSVQGAFRGTKSE